MSRGAASTLRGLLRVGRPPWSRLALSVLLGALTVLTRVGLMATAGYLVSRAAERPPVLSLTVAIVAVRAFGISRPVVGYADRLCSHDLALRVLSRMRVAFFRRIEPLVPDRSAGYHHGDLLSRVVGDVDGMQDLFLRGLAPPLVAVVSGAVSVGVTAFFWPAAAVVLAVGLLCGGIAVPVVAALLGRDTGARQVRLRGDLTVELVELLRGAPELVAFGADEAALQRVRHLDRALLRLGRRGALAGGVAEGLGVAVAGLTVAGVLATCVQASAAGGLDPTMVAALTLLAMASFEAVAPLPAAALTVRGTLASGRRLLEVTDRLPAVLDPPRPAAVPASAAVVADRVRLDDGDGSWGLTDVGLVLRPGARVVLVGPSGAGKSTLAAVLARFLDPDGGCVQLGGTDLRALRQHDVREAVSLDRQDAYLFSASLRDNVRLARPEAGDDAIDGVLRRVELGDWVASLPDGLDTVVGEDGAQVSGGERRRIALARVLLADRDVMVLDEPTAHLDAATADAVVAGLRSGADGRSVLMITHRLEGVDATDDVLELRRGRLARLDR